MPETYSQAYQSRFPVEQEVGYLPESSESPTLRPRLLQTKLGRTVAGSLACLGVMSGIGAANAPSAEADAALVYEVTNTNTPTTAGVFSRNSPHTNDTPKVIGHGAYDGDRVELICGVTNGDAVGPYDNNTWHYVKNLSRPNQPKFWLSDRHVLSPNGADQLAPGEKGCNEQITTPKPKTPEQQGCYFNFKWPKKNLTFSYEGNHRYYGNAWQAAQNWTELNTGISITPAPESQQGDIVFKDIYSKEPQNQFYGKTGVSEVVGNEKAYRNVPTNPVISKKMMIYVNQYMIEDYPDTKNRLNDQGRTYMLTHEIGHALGIGHPDGNAARHEGCGLDLGGTDTIMKVGNSRELVNEKPFNKPQLYDKSLLQVLYSGHGVDSVGFNYG